MSHYEFCYTMSLVHTHKSIICDICDRFSLVCCLGPFFWTVLEVSLLIYDF